MENIVSRQGTWKTYIKREKKAEVKIKPGDTYTPTDGQTPIKKQTNKNATMVPFGLCLDEVFPDGMLL